MDISIIIPVYNAENYLKECLNSALAQTVKKKEIICINDGSTDGSALILQEYQSNYDEILVLQQENSGAGKARNAGLEIAKGEFVCFLDADDYYLDQTALERMIQACKAHKVKVCGGFRKIKKDNCMELEKFELHRDICAEQPEGVLVEYLEYQDDYHYQNYIFDLEMIKKNDITFPFYRRYQDPPFFLQTMLIAKRMWIMPVELYCLRLGHQDFKKHGKLIKYTLMGIRDNMQLAKDYNLRKLQEKLVSRINNEFYWHITDNFSKEVFDILEDISKCILDSEISISVINELYDHYKLEAKYRYLEECYHELYHELYQELCSSYYIMRMFVETKYKGIRIEDYLLINRIKNIVIYGLGTFGAALYNELKDSEINVIYGIDKQKKFFYDLQIFSNVNNIEKMSNCDAIIVTPLKDGNIIADELKENVPIPVYTLIEILNEIEKNYVRKERRLCVKYQLLFPQEIWSHLLENVWKA